LNQEPIPLNDGSGRDRLDGGVVWQNHADGDRVRQSAGLFLYQETVDKLARAWLAFQYPGWQGKAETCRQG
jgi:hypothetical protein